jgi:hypothetical protein
MAACSRGFRLFSAIPGLFEMLGDRISQQDLDFNRTRRRIRDDGPEGAALAGIDGTTLKGHGPFQQGLGLGIAQDGTQRWQVPLTPIKIMDLALDNEQRYTVVQLMADAQLTD